MAGPLGGPILLTGSAALDDRAARAGILSEYRDLFGVWRETSAETKAALLAALGLSDADVARLGIALRFIGFLRIGLMAVNMAVSPRISRAVSAGNQQEADSLLVQSTHLKFWPTVLVTALVWWLAPFLVGLFGPEYASADWALRLFALLPLVAAFFGPSIMILNITGHQPQIFRVSAACVVLLVVAVPVAGVAFGVNGAALAAVLTVFFWEWALFNRVRRETGYNVSIAGVLFGGADREVRSEA